MTTAEVEAVAGHAADVELVHGAAAEARPAGVLGQVIGDHVVVVVQDVEGRALTDLGAHLVEPPDHVAARGDGVDEGCGSMPPPTASDTERVECCW